MKQETKDEITKISKEFTEGMGIEIHGSGFLIADPLSSYLSLCGYNHELKQLPPNDEHGLILVMIFGDGSKFILEGSSLPIEGSYDYMWI